jgi:hypothetical protein
MTPEQLTALAEEIAGVSILLNESMLENQDGENKDKYWAGGYRYEIFGGFPGWYVFCGQAGLALNSFINENDRDEIDHDYLQFVAYYSGEVWIDITQTRNRESYPDFDEMKLIARRALDMTLRI